MGQHHPEKSDGLRGWGCLYHGKASHVGTLLKGLCAQGGEEMADSSTPQVSESLDWEKLLSDHRFREADAHRKKTFDKLLISPDFRTAHEKDFDRIVFSSPVRRLQDKTQVFPLDQHDSVRTRLTHSIEVANIGRTLATQLVSELGIKLPRVDAVRTVPALVAAISIAHDIGNPPFGHQGEAAIRGWVGTIAEKYDGAFSSEKDQALLADYLNFDGNPQGFRLLTTFGVEEAGLNLTASTLRSSIKYPWGASSGQAKNHKQKFGYFQTEKPLFDWARKLPRQADISKVELSACRMRYSAGVSPPSESWGLSSL